MTKQLHIKTPPSFSGQPSHRLFAQVCGRDTDLHDTMFIDTGNAYVFENLIIDLALVRPLNHNRFVAVEWRGCDCQAGDHHSLAPRWVSSVLRNPVGRPRVSAELRTLIGEMSRANPLWGAPHIHGELLKLGFEVAQYMCRHSRPPSQGWRTFLSNHADGIAAVDLFVLPTIAFRILYCLVIIRHGRRIWVSFGVTANPTAEWISRQITEAFPWDHAPRYLMRDRDTSYGPVFARRVRAMGIRDRPIAFRSPWQNAYAERLIGSIRRECLDHISYSVKSICAGF